MARLASLLALVMGCYASHGVVEDEGPLVDSSVAARDAGPADGGPPDGGPVVEGPVLTDCAEAVASGREGQRCAFEGFCRGNDLCVAVDAGCWDGRLSLNEWTLGEESFDLGSCAASTGMAGITGMTPSGPIELSVAWASHSHAFAVDAVLVAHEPGGGSACGTDRLGVWIQPGAASSYLGVHEVLVLITTEALGTTPVPGIFEVVEFDDTAFIGGELSVDHGEWQLSGFLAAAPCPSLDRSSP